jgi:hypothetical protein
MRKLRLFSGIVAASLIAGALAATAATDPRSEKLRLTKVDMALAEREVLRGSDLGPGWRQLSVPYRDAPSCPNFKPNFSAYTITGRAITGFEYGSPAYAQVISEVEVFRTRAQAVGDFRLATAPQTARCLAYLFANGFGKTAPASVRLRMLSSRAVAAPRLGERSAAYRLMARVTGTGGSLTITVDFLAFQRGRSIAALGFTGVDSRVPSQTYYARLVADRLR